MQGTRKPPTSEVVEAAKTSDDFGRSTPRPVRSMRRDDRAEPDDDDSSSSRIDVVNVERGGSGDPSSTGPLGSLRRELARLNQQAAAVERSIEDQRRDRAEALERADRASDTIMQLEARIAGLENEAAALRKTNESTLSDLTNARSERDDLARAVEGAKAATAELAKYKEEADDQRARADAALRNVAQLEEDVEAAKKRQFHEALRATDKETELASTKEKLDRATGEASDARNALDKVTEDLLTVREEAQKTRDELAKTKSELAKSRQETTKSKEEAAKARDASTKASDDVEKARAELARAKEDNVRDRSTARDRIDLLERALDDARATASRAEGDLETMRSEREVQVREHEEALAKVHASEQRAREQMDAALTAASHAEARATVASASRAAVEEGVRKLRDDIAAAFTKIDMVAAAPPPRSAAPPAQSAVPGAAASAPAPAPAKDEAQPADASAEPPSSSEIVSMPPSMLKSEPPSPRAGPPPVPGSLPPNPVPKKLSVDSDWPAPASAPPPADASVAPSPASRSVPPPAPTSAEAPTYASVPPQVHPSAPPRVPTMPAREAALDVAPAAAESPPPPAAPQQPATAPPPSMLGSAPPAEAHRSSPPPPPSQRSLPPGPRSSSGPPPMRAQESVVPATRRASSNFPPPTTGASLREELLARLVDPDQTNLAATELRKHPDWLQGVPPPAFVAALSAVDYDAEGPVFELARLWDREPLCHALLAILRGEDDARVREHAAWLLKHLAAPTQWKAIADFAKNEEDSVQTRRWLLEALDRLAAGRAITWRELGDVVTTIARHPDATLRDGVVGILVSLDRSDDKRKLLLEILRADDDEVVIASAVNALASVLPIELDPVVVERLLGHPSPRVQRSVRELIERAKLAKQ